MFEKTADKRHCRQTGEGVGVNSSSSQSASKWLEAGMGCLPKNWQAMSVDEIKAPGKKAIISGPFGSNISSKYFVNDGVPVIRGNNLSLRVGRKFVDDGFVYITAEKAKELNTWATKGDLIFTAVGTIGQVGILMGKEKFDNYIISNKQLRLTVDSAVVDPLFSYYWFASDLIVEQIMQRNTGSSVPLINLSVLKSLIVPVPSLPEQKAIASVLSSLDDKIDLLNRQNKTLESMAETLFRQWFVSEEQKDWEERPLSEIADFLNGLACQKYPPKDDLNKLSVLKIKELSSGISDASDWATSEVDPKYIVEAGDVIFAWSASLMIKVWDGEKCVLNQHLFKVTSEEFPKWFYLMWCKRHLAEFISISASHATTMGHIKRGDLDNALVLIPSEGKILAMSEIMEPLLDRQIAIAKQIKSLEKLRNNLLPKLMSGEVRVDV